MVPRIFGQFPRPVIFESYDRVVLYIRFAQDLAPNTFNKPGSTILKLFHNVPKDDVEMLFPNTRLGMRLVDKLLIGVPALVSGGIVLTTKMGATLVLTSFTCTAPIVGALIAAAAADVPGAKWLGLLGIVLASVNIFGGFAVTERMLAMYKKKEKK